MAEIRGSVLGNLSGKLGNLSARTVNGRTILAARPSSYKLSNAPGPVAVRNKFRSTVALAKIVLASVSLKSVWKSVKPIGISAFNYSESVNKNETKNKYF